MGNNTVGGRMEGKDAEAYSLLQRMINKPGMYVGSSRFDYIDFLFSGYCIGRKLKIDFLPDRELQYWLLHTQSASLMSGSLSGASLFYRCFGTGQTAFDNYKVFFCADIPEKLNVIADEVHGYENKYNIVRYDWEDDVPADHYEKLAQEVGHSVRGIIDQAGLVYNDIKIYIRKEQLFNQVRFLVHGDFGWIDDSQIIADAQCHELLIAAHANARNAHAAELRKCGFDVFDSMSYDDSVLPLYDAFTNETAFSSEFARWKENLVKRRP